MTTLLVLGGTRFVGRAVVTEAVRRGWTVTTLHRHPSSILPAEVEQLYADRTRPEELAAALAGRSWDLVVDTWSDAPAVVAATARLLAGRVGRWAYVSSISVYVWGQHVDEQSPLVEGDPNAAGGDYDARKRGAELAVLAEFPDALLARPQLILGPWEDIGRLPWWLNRIAAGGRVVAPGDPDRALQYVDVRDLAGWLLTGLSSGLSGAIDVTSASGHATMGRLLEACRSASGSSAELCWIDEATLAAAGVEPWTQLPCWAPEHDPEFAGFLEGDAGRAAETGLVCRPIAETVADTWSWLRSEGQPAQRADRARHGLPAELEARLLA